jgi:hypothetical protein
MDTKLDFYADTKPDVPLLRSEYEQTQRQLDQYRLQCRAGYDDRRTYWPGKSADLRKKGATAFPWDGASDMEVPLIAEYINNYVSLCMSGLVRSNIRAYPVESGDAARAKVVSGFLKWMVHSYIPRFKQEMEANANYLFEKGMMVTYVGWNREDRSFLQQLSMDQIAQVSPDLAESIERGQDDDVLISMLEASFPNLVRKRAKKALKELRKRGVALLPVSRRQVDAPFVKAISPDGDIFFPPMTLDPQRAPYIFYRTYLTPQEIMLKVATEGWDEQWAEYVIEHFRGKSQPGVNDELSRGNFARNSFAGENDYIELVYCYQRLIDREDGAEGIYCTVFQPEYDGEQEAPGYGKYELLSGLEDYPFVVTRLSEESANLYDVQTFPDLLRGVQWQVKVERDQRIDKSSITTLPPKMHPVGRPPSDWGPGVNVPYIRPGEIHFAPAPPYSVDSAQIEAVLVKQAKALVGLDVESPLAGVRQQHYVDKFLSHVRDVLKMAWKAYQRYGPDEVFFRVTGISDPMKMQKGVAEEDFDIVVSFDTQNSDPETVEKRLIQLTQLLSLDRNGKFNVDALIEIAAGSIDPVLADAVLQPTEVAQEQIVKQVFDDLTKISSGIEVPARPQGAQIALSIIQQWASQPDVAQKLQEDEAFATRVQKYAGQYQFQMMQAQNAQTGRIGTAPAQMGGMQTQGMQL